MIERFGPVRKAAAGHANSLDALDRRHLVDRKARLVLQCGMNNCLVLRHVAFEHLGTLAAILAHRGIVPRYLDAGIGPIDPAEIARTDVLIFNEWLDGVTP